MSHRPNTAKKLARLRKAINRTPLPAYIDLVQFLKDRRYAQTTGEAEKILLDGRVKADSHTLGQQVIKAFEGGKVIDKTVVQRYADAKLRKRIIVLPVRS